MLAVSLLNPDVIFECHYRENLEWEKNKVANYFDGFEYSGAWFKQIDFVFNGKHEKVDVQIYGYDDNIIPNDGKNAFLNFVNNVDNNLSKIGEKVLEYYQNKKEELGHNLTENSSYTDYRSATDILSTVHLIGITIPDQDDFIGDAVFLVFNCDWDKESGLGIRLIGNKIEDIGGQDIAL